MFRLSHTKKDAPKPGEEQYTFLARGFEFKGTLTFEGTVRIDGHVSGEVHTTGTLILGEHAVIEGNITAGTIVSGGRINGNVVAMQRFQLLAPAALLGTVHTPVLQVEEGVRFYGNCEANGTTEGRLPENGGHPPLPTVKATEETPWEPRKK